MKTMALLGALALTAAATGAAAQSAADPLKLRGVMLQMQADSDAAASGIRKKDWPAVASHAEKLARHAEPPITEKVRILGWLLTDAPTFRNYDVQVKAAATELADAARKQDASAAASSYGKMRQSCDGCHNSFRTKFLAHFYGP